MKYMKKQFESKNITQNFKKPVLNPKYTKDFLSEFLAQLPVKILANKDISELLAVEAVLKFPKNIDYLKKYTALVYDFFIGLIIFKKQSIIENFYYHKDLNPLFTTLCDQYNKTPCTINPLTKITFGEGTAYIILLRLLNNKQSAIATDFWIKNQLQNCFLALPEQKKFELLSLATSNKIEIIISDLSFKLDASNSFYNNEDTKIKVLKLAEEIASEHKLYIVSLSLELLVKKNLEEVNLSGSAVFLNEPLQSNSSSSYASSPYFFSFNENNESLQKAVVSSPVASTTQMDHNFATNPTRYK